MIGQAFTLSLPITAMQNPISTPKDGHQNNFNFLRLLLATAVIWSHSFTLFKKDGVDKVAELTRTFTVGNLAVFGFFALSGFLIIQSWKRSSSWLSYLKKRAFRIYPGFFVASLFSFVVIGMIGAENPKSYLGQLHWIQYFKNTFLLEPPITPPVFKDTVFPVVNGSMWTIAYEFRCYLLLALFGSLGLDRNRIFWLFTSICILAFSIFAERLNFSFHFPLSQIIIGEIVELSKLSSFFFMGCCFYLWRDSIVFKPKWIIASSMICMVCIFHRTAGLLAFATFGAYVLFAASFANITVLKRYRHLSDVSYGVYLYGWPVQKSLIWFLPTLSPWAVFIVSFVISLLAGLLSWKFVEKPFLKLKSRESILNVMPQTA